ncbi:hypothetical protein FHP91_17625 [Denitromonas halophila]|uniref:Tox-ART-HYD1 domain-containing protein n=1 Tax=Denitromonas halophila TaxID=1629404 RepID=A0A557QHH4_9RHOO|nr:hypothetical protein FHP91_17625 [Denitromonas halophila]
MAKCEGTTRVRHYTNRKGSNGIEETGVIRAKDNNRVYLESASKKPLNQQSAQDKYQIAKGHGRDFVETDVESSRIEMIRNPRHGRVEMTVKGDLQLKNATITRRKWCRFQQTP